MDIFPDFYYKFKCIADRCPDSCCKDWDITVDDETAEFYGNVQGKFGDRLRKLMIIDSDGDRIFAAQDGKCPFWNDKKLCDIYTNCGEEHLCVTCNNFPRIEQDYTSFSEHMLSFACPEAARIILKDDGCFDCIECVGADGGGMDFQEDMMNFLIAARKISCDFFSSDENFQTQICKCFGFNERVQAMLDRDDYSILKLQKITDCTPLNMPDREQIFAFHKKLDIMDKQFFDDIQKAKLCNPSNLKPIENELKILVKYYFFRYYLTAIDSLDVTTTLNRIVCAKEVISSLITYKKAEKSFDEHVLIFQKYSKEIEHSYENTELFEQFALLI